MGRPQDIVANRIPHYWNGDRQGTVRAFLDIGVEFPALLEIILMPDLPPEHFQADDWCPTGSKVTARVASYSDSVREIYLSQVGPDDDWDDATLRWTKKGRR